MSVPHVVLGLLSRGESHGYELKREYDERFPRARPLAYGQVYATLERLLRDELIAATRTERADGPDRTFYAITDAGRAALTTWLEAVEPPAPYVASSLFTKVIVAAITTPDDSLAAAYLQAQREAHLARMREYTRLKTSPGASLGEALAADYAIVHLDADLRWIDIALSRVGALSQEVSS